MWQNFISELARTMDEILRSIARFLPHMLLMLVIIVVGWIIAFVVKVLLRSLLKIIRFDKLWEHTGATQLLRGTSLPSMSELISRFAFWIAWLGFILLGINVLGVVGLEEHVASFFGFLPRLFAALLILFFGLLAASFFSRATLLQGVNADLPSPRLISWAVRTIIVLFVVSMAFEELRLGSRTMIVAFALTFGSLMLGLALAFGLGGKELARRYLERKFARETVPEPHEHEDELSAL